MGGPVTADAPHRSGGAAAPTNAAIFGEPKVDCHCHVFDPARFPYGEDTFYRPGGQEIGTASQLMQMHDAYGVRYGLLVGPNSGYEEDNRCMLDAIARGNRRYKGIAVVANDADEATLAALQNAGVVGVAFNATHHGVDRYLAAGELLAKLRAFDMCVSLQVQHDQLVLLGPFLERSGVRILVDHCGRPTPDADLAQPGFQALLRLARSGRAFVKLSGYAKFSREAHPYPDVRPFVQALLEAFTPARTLWASDWPFLRAPERIDVGPLLALVESLLPDPAVRRDVLWQVPCALFGFDAKG
jgi:predicted TIM-barrel fold metal-dependent hydrolase